MPHSKHNWKIFISKIAAALLLLFDSNGLIRTTSSDQDYKLSKKAALNSQQEYGETSGSSRRTSTPIQHPAISDTPNHSNASPARQVRHSTFKPTAVSPKHQCDVTYNRFARKTSTDHRVLTPFLRLVVALPRGTGGDTSRGTCSCIDWSTNRKSILRSSILALSTKTRRRSPSRNTRPRR